MQQGYAAAGTGKGGGVETIKRNLDKHLGTAVTLVLLRHRSWMPQGRTHRKAIARFPHGRPSVPALILGYATGYALCRSSPRDRARGFETAPPGVTPP